MSDVNVAVRRIAPAVSPARAGAVAKFRQLADRLESGELRGARVSWREGRDFVEVVECDEHFTDGERSVRLTRESV